MKKYLLSLVFGVTLGCAAVAQPFGTDLFACSLALSGSNLVTDVVRVDPNGVVTTQLVNTTFPGAFPNMAMMDNNNTDLVLLETQSSFSGPDVLGVWNLLTSTRTTTLTGPAGVSLNWFDETGDGDFFAVGGTSIYRINRNGSGFSTILSGAPLQNLHSCVRDLRTAGIAAGDLTSRNVFLIAQDGTVTTTWVLGQSPFSMTQDHLTGEVIVGSGGAGGVFAIDTILGAVRTVSASAGTNANATTFDRGTGNGEIVTGSKPILRMTTGGTVITSHAGVPGISNAGMCFDRGRNVVCVKTGSPNKYRYQIDIPTQGGNGYVLALSATGFTPGIGIDTRTIPLALDNLLLLTAQGAFPFLQNNIGTLNAAGNRFATLDLSSLGTAVQGFRLWAAAVTIDGSAPSNIGVVTKPTVTLLE